MLSDICQLFKWSYGLNVWYQPMVISRKIWIASKNSNILKLHLETNETWYSWLVCCVTLSRNSSYSVILFTFVLDQVLRCCMTFVNFSNGVMVWMFDIIDGDFMEILDCFQKFIYSQTTSRNAWDVIFSIGLLCHFI